MVSCATIAPLKCSYMGVACGFNTSSGDIFETGFPNYQLTAGVGKTESWGGEQAGQTESWGGEQAGQTESWGGGQAGQTESWGGEQAGQRAGVESRQGRQRVGVESRQGRLLWPAATGSSS